MTRFKITREFPYTRPLISLSSYTGGAGDAPAGQVPTSIGSNGQVSWGSNIGTVTVNGSSQVLGPYINFANGSNTTVTVDQVGAVGSNTIRIHATGGSGSLTVADEGTPLATAATTLDFVGAGVTATGAGATKTITIPGGSSSSAEDPVADIFGTPDTAYEFDAALSGWTNMGSATAQDADSTVPGHYYVYRAATSSVALTGIYRAVGSFPQTYIAKVSDHNLVSINYIRLGGLFVAEASPGVVEAMHIVYDSGQGGWLASHVRYSNPTTFSAVIGSDVRHGAASLPIYYGIVVNSSTDVDFWYSIGGRIWHKRTDARNPSITVGSFGICVDPENATYGAAGAFDYLRVWDSAKTFPGF